MAALVALSSCSETEWRQAMSLAILFAAALSLPPSARAVRIAADTWPSTIDVTKVEAPQPGEKIWWWSADCVPAIVTVDTPQTDCRSGRTATVRILDERGRKVAGGPNVGGTARMLPRFPQTNFSVWIAR